MDQTLFEKFVQERGLKLTPERQEILAEVLDIGEPFEIDTLLFRLKQRKRKTSKATIYRTVQLLLECGILKKLSLTPEGNDTRYGVCVDGCAYDNMICPVCGKIVDFRKDDICRLCETITGRYGWELQSHTMSIYAICPDCQNKSRLLDVQERNPENAKN